MTQTFFFGHDYSYKMQMTAPPPHPNLNVVTFFIDTFGGKKSLKGP